MMMTMQKIPLEIFAFSLSILFVQSSELSFNQPNFADCVSWNQVGEPLAMNDTIGDQPKVIFVDRNNNVYLAAQSLDQIQMLSKDNNSFQSIFDNVTRPHGLFVTNDNDIYIGNGDDDGSVIKYSMNTETSTVIMQANGTCYSLFIDSNDTIYCSLFSLHQVIKYSLIDAENDSLPIAIAGNGTNGSLSTLLDHPIGIFVDLNFTLYVADCFNHRIQKFLLDDSNGTTVLGNDATKKPNLLYPTAVFIDGNGSFFVADHDWSRILRIGPYDYWCIIGCSDSSSESILPWSFSFDQNGNLFVVDSQNATLTKFSLATNSCNISYNQPVLCPAVSWNPDVANVVDNLTVGDQPQRIFVDKRNYLYVAAPSLNSVVILNGKNIVRTLNDTINVTGVFVTTNGDVYYTSDNGSYTWIYKWSSNSNGSMFVVLLESICTSILLDFHANIYCSMPDIHQVIRYSAEDKSIKIIAGNGTAGSAPNQLNKPRGIFLTTDRHLYVADCDNDRIQLFRYGQINGATVLSNSSTRSLRCPNAVALDGYGYLYVSVWSQNRVVRLARKIFECIAGCTAASNELYYPRDIRFDTEGSLYVCDSGNNRIRKFSSFNNLCGTAHNRPKLSFCATWNSSAVALLNQTIAEPPATALFVDHNNSVYIAESSIQKMIGVWEGRTSTLIRSFNESITNVTTVFVQYNGDIYYDNNNGSHYYITKWMKSTNTSNPVMYNTEGTCTCVFVDYYDQIYCSMNDVHKVIRRSPYDSIDNAIIIAGNGSAGSAAHQLNNPRGIFVTNQLDLYVADCANHRIQLFLNNQKNASTIPINSGFNLSCPNSIILDADGNLFISESDSQRIIRIWRLNNSYTCLLGCPYIPVSPGSLNFDTSGNLYILDVQNHRALKLFLTSNSCSSNAIRTVTQSMNEWTSHVQTTIRSTKVSPTQSSSIMSTTANLFKNIAWTACDILQPCNNKGTCTNTNYATFSYNCTCPTGFRGTNCQLDVRLCRSTTCRNGGTCQMISNDSFICHCPSAWQGRYCEWKKNYCENVSCLNDGVCLLINDEYRCECVSDGYSGEHCETTSGRIVMYEFMSRSFAFVAITMIASVALFIIIMDVLKYWFQMDLAKMHRRMRKKKRTNKRRMGLGVHYVYVNAECSPN